MWVRVGRNRKKRGARCSDCRPREPSSVGSELTDPDSQAAQTGRKRPSFEDLRADWKKHKAQQAREPGRRDSTRSDRGFEIECPAADEDDLGSDGFEDLLSRQNQMNTWNALISKPVSQRSLDAQPRTNPAPKKAKKRRRKPKTKAKAKAKADVKTNTNARIKPKNKDKAKAAKLRKTPKAKTGSKLRNKLK